MRSTSECWHVIESWLAANGVDDVLAEPAPDADIAAVEETVDVTLPESFCTFLQTHNGQTPDSRPLLRRFGLYSTSAIISEWKRMTDLLRDGTFEGRLDDFDERFGRPGPEVRDVWWNDQWIPFARDAGGNLLCIDLDPSPAGSQGQIIVVWHDMPTRPVRASSFAEWFQGYATAIEEGELVYSERTHSMMSNSEEH
ncbi:SMI1/KNR4 family protein [Halogeometricum borinquense]|uniref:SMI1/KNR4 family protein n=1 Tax=Halogeometricum borinquense TaxID=60847 RepID=UPI003419DC66